MISNFLRAMTFHLLQSESHEESCVVKLFTDTSFSYHSDNSGTVPGRGIAAIVEL
jgi:hypothetical protein